MAECQGAHQIFPFFKLARELRDMIYPELTRGKRIIEADSMGKEAEGQFVNDPLDWIRIALEGSSVPELRLVSHQFMSEYEAAVRRTETLILSDHERFNFHNSGHFHVSQQLGNVANLSLRLGLECDEVGQLHAAGTHPKCHAPHDLHRHLRWLTSLIAEFPRLRSSSLTLRTGMYCRLDSSSLIALQNGRLRSGLSEIVKLLPSLGRISTGQGRTEYPYVEIGDGDNAEDILTWTAATGWQGCAGLGNTSEQ